MPRECRRRVPGHMFIKTKNKSEKEPKIPLYIHQCTLFFLSQIFPLKKDIISLVLILIPARTHLIMASLASPPLESAPGDAAAPSPPAPTAESRARAAAARALAASTSSATMMSTAHILEFIASCVEAGVDTSAFDNYRAFVRAVDANQDGNVSRAELYEWLVKNRGAFSNEQLREIRVVMEQPRYVETKYGLESCQPFLHEVFLSLVVQA